VTIPGPVSEFAATKAYGRKLITLLAMQPRERPVGYADSDVLFHRGAEGFANFVDSVDHQAFFVQDCQEALDVRLIPPDERRPPLNSGFLLTGRPIDWQEAARRLGEIGEADAPGYGWTEQSVAHIAYREAHGQPLPPEHCVVALHDQYAWADKYTGTGTWLRHYVTGTRFKMWLCLLGAVEG
jgi:hypothetical protein